MLTSGNAPSLCPDFACEHSGCRGGQGRTANEIVADSVVFFDVLAGVTLLLLACLVMGMVRGCA